MKQIDMVVDALPRHQFRIMVMMSNEFRGQNLYLLEDSKSK